MNHESTTEKWIQGWIVGKELVLTSIVTFRFTKNGTQCHLLVIKVVGTFVPYSLRIVCRKEKTPSLGTGQCHREGCVCLEARYVLCHISTNRTLCHLSKGSVVGVSPFICGKR
jgi:hypothetical protein